MTFTLASEVRSSFSSESGGFAREDFTRFIWRESDRIAARPSPRRNGCGQAG